MVLLKRAHLGTVINDKKSYREMRDVRSPTELGIIPVNWFTDMSSVSRFVSLPMLGGIVPEMELFCRYLRT